MPEGLTNAPAAFQRFMNDIFADFFILFLFYHFIDLEAEPMMVVWRSIHVGPSLGI